MLSSDIYSVFISPYESVMMQLTRVIENKNCGWNSSRPRGKSRVASIKNQNLTLLCTQQWQTLSTETHSGLTKSQISDKLACRFAFIWSSPWFVSSMSPCSSSSNSPISCTCTKDAIIPILDSLYEVRLPLIWGEWQLQISFELCFYLLYWSFRLFNARFFVIGRCLASTGVPLVREWSIRGREGVCGGVEFMVLVR